MNPELEKIIEPYDGVANIISRKDLVGLAEDIYELGQKNPPAPSELSEIVRWLKMSTHENNGEAFESLANDAFRLGQQNPGPTRYIVVRITGRYSRSPEFWEETLTKQIMIHAYSASNADKDELHARISSTDWNLIQRIPGWETQLREVK